MVRRWVWGALALPATGACLITTSLGGLTGGGVDASSDSHDQEAGIDAAGHDASGDAAAAMDADGGGSRWCTSNTPDGGMCWDFDDGQLTAGWTGMEVSTPLGLLRLEDTGASSPPFAMYATVLPTQDAGVTVSAKVSRTLVVFPATVDIAFDARGSIAAGGQFVILEIYVSSSGGYSHVELGLSEPSNVTVSSYATFRDGGGQSMSTRPIGILSDSAWTRIALHVEYTANASGGLGWTLSGAFGGAPFTGSPVAMDGLPTSPGRLLLGLRASKQTGAMHYDNVTLVMH